MHMRVLPVFFFTNTTVADQTLSLGSIMSFANISAVCLSLLEKVHLGNWDKSVTKISALRINSFVSCCRSSILRLSLVS